MIDVSDYYTYTNSSQTSSDSAEIISTPVLIHFDACIHQAPVDLADEAPGATPGYALFPSHKGKQHKALLYLLRHGRGKNLFCSQSMAGRLGQTRRLP